MTPRLTRVFGFVGFALFAVFILVMPLWIGPFRAQQFAYVAIYLIALLGLNILTGYTGQISLGHGAFMAIGGYTTALLMAGNEQFGQEGLLGIGGGMKDVWTIPIAGLVAGLVGLAFGLPALRLSGLYLALATFAIAVAMPSVIKRFEEFSGGGSGVQLFGLPELTAGIVPVEIFGQELVFNDWLYYLCWSIALVAFAVAWLILRGRTGRAFRAVRDSETAAVSSGVSLARYKTLAFGISAAYAGVAGLALRHRYDVRQPGHVPDRALDLPAGRRGRGRARRALGARRGGDLHPVPAALGPGRGRGVATARRHRGSDEGAGRARDHLRRRAHSPDVLPPERRRRSPPAGGADDHTLALLSFELTSLGGDVRRQPS